MLSAPTTTLSTTDLLSLYRQMVLIRRTEEALARAHQAGRHPRQPATPTSARRRSPAAYAPTCAPTM